MSVFRRLRTRGGKKTKDKVWTVEFADHEGITRRVSAFTDKSASGELERHIRRLVALRQAGATPDVELGKFLETVPAALREKFGTWGLISGDRAAAGKVLVEHIENWRLAMVSKGNSPEHIRESVAKVTRLCSTCGWKYPSHINAGDFDKWRVEQKGADTSSTTLNHYLTVAKTFCNWLVKKKRLLENPLDHLSRLNAVADRRLERHPFTVDELGKLLAATEAGPMVHGMAGQDRALLYRTAVETGLRWSELRSLTRASFDFTGEAATVTIAAEDAKNGKEDCLPLRSALALALKNRMSTFLPAAKAFQGMWGDKGAEMIRIDLEAAGILVRNDAGDLIVKDEYGRVYDFHSLRHTFASLLNLARVPLATAQKLMRHSDPKLTANIYTHVMVETKVEALEKLPAIAATPIEVQTAAAARTGTDDLPVAEAKKKWDRPGDSIGTDSTAK